jgi:hypothetical protein
MEEIIKRIQDRILNHQNENGFETIFDFLNEDVDELQEKLCNLDIVRVSLRDKFAAQAMNALVNKLASVDGYENCTIESLSKESYEIADTMLKFRSNEP